MIVIVPSRRGVWARTDSTPYGQGLPYSKSQLRDLLQRAGFSPIFWGEALHAPPINRPFMMRSATTIEPGFTCAWSEPHAVGPMMRVTPRAFIANAFAR